MKNSLFLSYAEHEQDLEDAVNILMDAIKNGETNCTINFDTEVSKEEINWVKKEAIRRLNKEV